MEAFPILNDKNGVPLDQVRVTNLAVDCIVGIYPNERTTLQKLQIDLCLYTDISAAAKSASIADALDYASIVKEITFIIQAATFLLIESAADTLCRFLSLKHQQLCRSPQLLACCFRISKPNALPNETVPSVQVTRMIEQPKPNQFNRPEALLCSNGGSSLRMISLKPYEVWSLSQTITAGSVVVLFPINPGLTVESFGNKQKIEIHETFECDHSMKCIVNTGSDNISCLIQVINP